MTTPTGQISLDDVKDEFGRAAPDGDTTGTAISLGKYRVNDAATLNKPLDVGVPQSGTIKMSDLKGRTRNVVFRYSGTIKREDLDDTEKAALNLKSVYDANQNAFQDQTITQPLMVGGFITRPTDLSDTSKPVIITAQVDGILGSKRTTYGNPSEQFVALDTGTFGIGSSIRIQVTNTGQIYGAGGRGGRGSSGNGNGGDGINGTTAIGVRAGNGSVTIVNQGGLIQCGFAGGGGGGGSYDDPSKSMTDPVTSGGGGGGGAGFPPGLGGAAGTNAQKGTNGAAGTTAASQTRGNGGAGGSPNEGSSGGGDGGNGGDNNIAAENGDDGAGGNQANGTKGSAGSNGAAVRLQAGATAPTYINDGFIIGSTTEVGFTGN